MRIEWLGGFVIDVLFFIEFFTMGSVMFDKGHDDLVALFGILAGLALFGAIAMGVWTFT